MANEVERQSTDDAYIALPQVDERAAAIMRSCMSGSFKEFGTLVMQRMPDRESRQALAARQKTLVDSLKHERKKIALMITEMLQGYRQRGVKPGEAAGQIVALYVRELGLDPKIPTWAVWRACGAIRIGGDPERLEKAGVRLYEAPTTMTMRRLCDSYVWDVRAEMSNIGAILQGREARPVVPPEERERVSKEFRTLADDMKVRLAADKLMGPPPMSKDDLVDLAGGEEAFAALPDAKTYGKSKQMAEFAQRLVEP